MSAPLKQHCLVAWLIVLCGSTALAAETNARIEIIVSVRQQRMLVLYEKRVLAIYPVSTSKFGTGDNPGRYCTPLGILSVREKIGDGAPLGAVFKSRRRTGEVLPPNARGRDPIVTRILWLDGEEPANRNSFARCIYIHGTPQEKAIGRPASYGCIRMRSLDVAKLYEVIACGTLVRITKGRLPVSPAGYDQTMMQFAGLVVHRAHHRTSSSN